MSSWLDSTHPDCAEELLTRRAVISNYAAQGREREQAVRIRNAYDVIRVQPANRIGEGYGDVDRGRFVLVQPGQGRAVAALK